MSARGGIYAVDPRAARPAAKPAAADAIGIALVGAGGISRAHLNAIAALPEHARLVAVADVDRVRAERAAGEYGAPAVYEDWREALSDPAVEAVAICTPPFLHAEIAGAALQAGRHVLCEKPVAGTLAAMDVLQEVERGSGRVCSGVFQLRFGTGARQLRALLDARLFGRLTFGLSETLWRREPSYFSDVWRGTYAGDFGGVATIQAIHTIDLLRSLLGAVESVQAEAATLVHSVEVEDTLVATVRFAGGALAQLTATINAQDNRSRLELFGTRLQAVSSESAYDCTATRFRLAAADADVLREAERLSTGLPPGPADNLHIGQYVDFCAAVRDACPPLVSLAECRATLELITALYKSARTMRRVDLPIAADDPWYRSLPPA